MQNFSPLASKLREEIEDGRDGGMLVIQKFTVFEKNLSLSCSGIKKLVVLADGGYKCIIPVLLNSTKVLL